MNITKFNEKFNKLDGNIYTVEEKVDLISGIYEGALIHDNVDSSTVNVYTGSKLTGDKINNYVISTPSLTPWKTSIRVLSNITPVYITYETTGDQVEAEDINNLQAAVNNTEATLNSEVARAAAAENALATNLNTESARSKAAENTLTSNLSAEATRAAAAEATLTNTINTSKLVWDDKYTKNEVDNKFSQYTTNMDWKESVANFAAIATTYPTPADGWTVNVNDTDITYRYNGATWIPISANSIPLATTVLDGKMSAVDKNKLNGIIAAATKTAASLTNGHIKVNDAEVLVYTHPGIHAPSMISQDANNRFATDTEKTNWNAAFTHISDVIKHTTGTERTLWNTVSNKLDAAANAVSASKLQTARNINGVAFDGSTDITVADGTKLPLTGGTLTGTLTGTTIAATTFTGALSGNATSATTAATTTGNAGSATKLQVTRTINGVSFDGSANITITAAPTAHTHDDRYYTETESDIKYATKSEVSAAGYGDMTKAIYDTDGDGVVDNAETAIKLLTARTINGISFDGSANITVTDSTKLSLSGGTLTGALTGTAISATTFTGSLNGNAATSTKLATARAINLTGDVIGSANFDGSAAVSITTTLKAGLTWNDIMGV